MKKKVNSKEMTFHGHTCRSLLSQCLICNIRWMFFHRGKYKIHLLCRSNSVAEEKCHYGKPYLAAVSHICNSYILKSSIITDWEGKALNLKNWHLPAEGCFNRLHASGKAMNYLMSWWYALEKYYTFFQNVLRSMKSAVFISKALTALTTWYWILPSVAKYWGKLNFSIFPNASEILSKYWKGKTF